VKSLKRLFVGGAIAAASLGAGGCSLLGVPPVSNPPPPASLELTTTPFYSCGNFTCWGIVSWSGLKAPSTIVLSGQNLGNQGPVFVFAASAMNQGLNLPCGAGVMDVVATGTTASGSKISSTPPIDSPCG
jgi:hypothetical protein